MRRTGGFTLLEILVALTLFAVVGGALLTLFQSGLRSTRLSDEYAHAALLARSKLTELQAYAVLVPGTYDGSFDDRYRWRVELIEMPELAEDSRLELRPLRVDVEVIWGEDRQQRVVALDSLLLSAGDAP
jgi:general secretion pathway protein I